jgi:acyl dehydratase
MQTGDCFTLNRTVTEADLELFAELSSDRNPIHFSEDFASKTMFGKRIAHGMIGVALISGALTELVGPGNIWLSTELEFKKPIYIGDEIACSLCVTSIERRSIYVSDVIVTNQHSEVLIKGSVKSMKSV